MKPLVRDCRCHRRSPPVAPRLFQRRPQPRWVDTSTYGAGDDWDNPGGDWAESHFSRLTNRSTRQRLHSWASPGNTISAPRACRKRRPVVIDGVMYTSGNLGRVYALDAATGRGTVDLHARGRHAGQPRPPAATRPIAASRWPTARSSSPRSTARSTRSTRRPANVVWKRRHHRRSRARLHHHRRARSGRQSGDHRQCRRGIRHARLCHRLRHRRRQAGLALLHHSARSQATGPQENPALEAALKTWSEDTRWDIGGGGTAWDAIIYDPQFDQVIVGTGNGGPYPQAIRSPGGGDNLYLDSLVALDRKTGKMKWYFQETPQDHWDLTATQPMILASLEIGGRAAPGHPAYAQERLLLRGRPRDRQAAAANPLVRTNWADGLDLETRQAAT